MWTDIKCWNQTPQQDFQKHKAKKKKQGRCDLFLHGSTRRNRYWITLNRETINKKKRVKIFLQHLFTEVLQCISFCFRCMHSLLYVHKLLHSVAPDVEASGANLCSGVLSLHEAAADGKHGARMSLKARPQLWSTWAKPEPHLSKCQLMHKHPESAR